MFKFFRSKQKEPEKIEKKIELLSANDARKISEEKLPIVKKLHDSIRKENYLLILKKIHDEINNRINMGSRHYTISNWDTFGWLDANFIKLITEICPEIQEELISKGYKIDYIKDGEEIIFIKIRW